MISKKCVVHIPESNTEHFVQTIHDEFEKIGLYTPDRCLAGAPPENAYTRIKANGIMSYYFNLAFQQPGQIGYALGDIEQEAKKREGEYKPILFKFPEEVEKADGWFSASEQKSR